MKTVIAILTILAISLPTLANDTASKSEKTVGEKIESGYEKAKDSTKEAYEDTKKATKKAYRSVKDKTCEMVNGKMECAVKKVGNSIKNGTDEVKDKANDLIKE